VITEGDEEQKNSDPESARRQMLFKVESMNASMLSSDYGMNF